MPRPTERFSSRVENYVRYRPKYPPGLAQWLLDQGIVRPGSVVADVGSGTGFLAELLLDAGCSVIGVEPNREVREAGDRYLARHAQFRSVGGSAEATGLEAGSVEAVAAGQAFHWFDREKAREEFARILRPGGWVVLAWNERRDASSPFLAEYEQLLHRYSPDYLAVDHRRMSDELLRAWFGGPMRTGRFDNIQHFDAAGLRGRLLSSSYAPEPGHPQHEPMLRELERIFAAHQSGGSVCFEYDTKVYCGQLP